MAADFPSKATVFEVGPRDGLQAETKTLGLEERFELIRRLMRAGLEDIEVGSFVRDDWIPQLKGSGPLLQRLKALPAKERGDTKFWAFIPNDVGLKNGLEAGLDGAGFFVAASDTFCQKNVNRGQSEILEKLEPLLKSARKAKIKNRVYLSTLVYCPYEGPTAPEKIVKLVNKLVDMGAKEIVLSDTTGHANPRSVRRLLEKLLKKHSPKLFAMHMHDTRGLALANCLEAFHLGITRFDSSVAGIGGCPYAPGASGNLATEDLVNMLAGMGVLKSVDLGLLARAGHYAQKQFGRTLPSRVLQTFPQEAGAQ